MNYILLVYSAEGPVEGKHDSPDACLKQSEQLIREGKMLDGAILHGTDCATSVQVRQGQRMVTDGPFAETREQLAGYMIVDVENLDEAIAIAGSHPAAGWGTVEIRPFSLPPMTLRRPEAAQK